MGLRTKKYKTFRIVVWKFGKLKVLSFTCQAFSFRYVGGDGIKDVDKHEEYSDQKRHASWYDFRRYQKTDPGDDNKHTRRKVVSDNVMGYFSS